MEAYQVLEKALGLIENEENWVSHSSGGPRYYCAIGALRAAWDGPESIVWIPGYRSLKAACPMSIPDFNDSHSHAEVCDLFKRAVADAKSDAGIYLEVPAKEGVEANV